MLGGVAVVLYVALFRDGGTVAPSRTVAADPTDAALVAQGAELYAAQCASCHGRNREGEPGWRSPRPDGSLGAPPHDATGHTWHHPDSLLFADTKFGGARFARGTFKSNMPAFQGTLSDRQIAAVLAFIKSRWPADIRERQARISRAFERRR